MSPELSDALTKAVGSVIPLLPLFGIWAVWRYFDKQNQKQYSEVEKKTESFVAAVEKIWPHVLGSQCSPEILSKDPDSWFVVTKHLAERSAKSYVNKKLGDIKK